MQTASIGLPEHTPACVANTGHSIPTTDRDTVVVDSEGRRKVVYRGEHGADTSQLTTRLPSLTFSSAEAASVYALDPNNRNDRATAPRTIPAYLQITRPVFDDPNDPFIDLSILVEAIGHDRAVAAALRVSAFIAETNNWLEHANPDGYYLTVESFLDADPSHIDALYVDIFPVLDDPETVADLVAAGYDGAIHAGMGATHHDTEYRVFSPAQVHYALNGQCAA